MTTELVKTETTAIVTSTPSMLDEMGVSASDLSIAKLLLMQSTSEMVGDGKASFGDIVNSLTGEKLGDFSTGVEIIPLKVSKTWVIFDMSSGQPEFMRVEPFTAENSKWDWTALEDGKPIRRDQSINFYVVLVKDVAEQEGFPVVISFRRTSYSAGKALVTQIMKQRMFKKTVYSKTAMLKVLRQKNGTNTYAIFEVAPGRVTTPDEVQVAESLIELLSTKQTVVDDSDLKRADDIATTVQAPKPTIIKADGAVVDEVY